MDIFTIGFTKKSARQFFSLIKENRINLLLDIRLNNSSQLAGFSKGSDLEYFLTEICDCKYEHDLIFAPTAELMNGFKDKKITPEQFEQQYMDLMSSRGALKHFSSQYVNAKNVCLLCSEERPTYCHRRVLADMLISALADVNVYHL